MFWSTSPIWLQQINDVGGYENRKPSFRRRLTDPDIPCHRGKVDELPGGRCGSRHKASEFHGVPDLGQVTDIPFNIGTHIGAIKHLPIKIRILTKLRHLSKGIVQKGSTEQLLFVLYGGQKFELTGNAAATWLNGRFNFAEALGRNETLVIYLQKLGLAETEADNDELSRYRIASRCIFCPADTAKTSALRAMDKEILQWLKNAGVRLTVAELVYLIENGIKPTQDLLYTDNRQKLIERIYTVDTIADNLLETQMKTAKCRDAVVQSLMRLLKKKLVLVL